MDAADRRYLEEFYGSVADHPLDPDSPQYVGLYDNSALGLEDPVRLLARNIEWSSSNSSAQLFSGFRGSGKSTELRRLRHQLSEQGYLVLLFDVFEYLAPSLPLDVSEFLMVMAGALSDQLEAVGAIAGDGRIESYWQRLTAFLRTRVQFEEVTAGLGPLEVKASLSADPSFRERLQASVAGHLAALVDDMRTYVRQTLAEIATERIGEGLVLLADSIENISGTLSNAQEVQESVERLFTNHAEHLQLPQVHVIYTVPPWLKIRAPGVSRQYSGGLHMLHPLRVRDSDGAEVKATLDALCEVVSARGDWQRLLSERTMLDQLALESGGHLRDLLRMLAEIAIRADRLPVEPRIVQQAITQMRSELLPIAEDDARWLDRIAQTHDVSLSHIDRLPRLVTFLDSHLVLCYRNGEDWYDIHPLVREEVHEIAVNAQSRAESTPTSLDPFAATPPAPDPPADAPPPPTSASV
jgi:hypothetical protein